MDFVKDGETDAESSEGLRVSKLQDTVALAELKLNYRGVCRYQIAVNFVPAVTQL